MASGSDSITAAVTDAVQALVAQAPRLRRVQQRLWIDTLAVCSDVRPAAMLDFCPGAPAHAVQQMCGTLSSRLHKPIFALSWQHCLWIVSHTRLVVRVQAVLAPHTGHPIEAWLVDFCADNAAGPPCIRPADDARVKRHLQSMLGAFAIGVDAGVGADCRGTPLVELDEEADIGNLPFVNGVLLGYPFIYYVTAENVNRASAWLSSSRLQLFRQTGLQAGGFRECGGGGSQLRQREGDCDLWTCSAPLDAVDPGGRRVDVVELWGEWCAHHRARAGWALDVWADLRFVDSRAGPQAVVL